MEKFMGNYHLSELKTEIKGELSNGQKYCYTIYYEIDWLEIPNYNVAFCIYDQEDYELHGGTEHLFEGLYDDRNIVGRCGLEGLRIAFKITKELVDFLNKNNEQFEIGILGQGKRGRAYKYLERIGFESNQGFNEKTFIYKK